MSSSPLLTELIEALRCLPGVGAKSAQRMALHLLERDREGGRRLSAKLADAVDRIGNCARCRNFSEAALCALCRNPQRDAELLCLVETPMDQLAVEQATGFRGYYFVMHGRLSPLDGLGPAELGLEQLREGEATAHYVAQMAREAGVRATRLAHGVPLGGELEFVDRGTLAHAFGSRRDV